MFLRPTFVPVQLAVNDGWSHNILLKNKRNRLSMVVHDAPPFNPTRICTAKALANFTCGKSRNSNSNKASGQ